ncbi:hypothetical protein BDQ17DRAFT_1425368 [Cyathus striatus]|nr:hypothetical protein BDQ17DRAFT_1425368 [Cyathus striatus]
MQLSSLRYDAFKGHRKAWEKCGILHRDISGNNVMLDRWGHGVLNDWDLARRREEMDQAPHTHVRTGTWYFVSTLLLMKPGKRHDVHDGLESFVLLVLFHVLSSLEHSRSEDLGVTIFEIFERSRRTAEGYYIGGREKNAIFADEDVCIECFQIKDNTPPRLVTESF